MPRYEDSKTPTATSRSQRVNFYDNDAEDYPIHIEIPRLRQTFPRSHRHERAPFLKPRDVFERLTDHRFFTGAHRHRFDENGNGRGLAGREEVYIFDGNTESTSRIHEVYSTVIRRPHKTVIPYGTLGVQKFGVQIATPKLMWLYRNGDKYHDGIAFYVRPFIKNVDMLFFYISKELPLIAGPVRRIYDQNLRLVTSIEEIVDGAKYLCTSGRFYMINIKVTLGEPPAPAHRLHKFMDEWVIQRFAH
ncbi:Protein doublecortin [Babesia sp. Xinjiang]|uniref:Protein doublecortin n=1 Tax=Babesia sp. Xinjiang TaxID=462227 RepID=UPI000A248A3A|nr:Protein doublecortin [Babesia sp. Xinjiang]ORM40656.1 Protein doublecortin [Babesia sp. Xinjiang]